MSDTTPQPVLGAANIASVVTLVVGVLGTVGITIDADDQKLIIGLIGAVITVIGIAAHQWAAVKARGKVTPTSKPHMDDGTPLIAAPSDGLIPADDSPEDPWAAPEDDDQGEEPTDTPPNDVTPNDDFDAPGRHSAPDV